MLLHRGPHSHFASISSYFSIPSQFPLLFPFIFSTLKCWRKSYIFWFVLSPFEISSSLLALNAICLFKKINKYILVDLISPLHFQLYFLLTSEPLYLDISQVSQNAPRWAPNGLPKQIPKISKLSLQNVIPISKMCVSPFQFLRISTLGSSLT